MNAIHIVEARINRALDWYFARRAGRASSVGASVRRALSAVPCPSPFIAVSFFSPLPGWPALPRVESMSRRFVACDMFSPLEFAEFFPYRDAGRMLREAFEDGRIDASEYEVACRAVLTYRLLTVEEAKRRQRERETGRVATLRAL